MTRGREATSAAEDKAAVSARSLLRSVAGPTEHGGWGLTLEPAILGLVVAPSGAGACLATAAIIAFLVRTPLKTVLVDRHRKRRLTRTRVAEQVVVVEVLVLASLVAASAALADGPFWVPAVVASPLVALELWFDMRSRSRRLVPELAGAIGVSAVVAMIVLADGRSGRLAAALWLALTARVITSIPWVRAQIARIHNRNYSTRGIVAADVAALSVAAVAAAIDPSVTPGAIAVAVLIVVQRISALGPLPRATILGVRQVLAGLVVVAATALGVLAA
jgi:hypothetical protein